MEIALEGIKLFARHGYYEEERVRGNEFTVDIKVIFPEKEKLNSDDLGRTLNYEQLYQIAEDVMKERALLLETVADKMLEKIFSRFDFVTEAFVSISKHNPPVRGGCERAKVSIRRKRNG